MRALRVVGLTEDGDVVLEDPVRLERYTVPADERLRAAARGDLSRLGQIAIELESQLRPREIQARIRAGASVEQVATAAGVPEQKIERFAYPVLTERFRTADNAQRAHPMRADGPDNRTLAEVVAHTLGLRGQTYDGAKWDSWKGEDGRWVVALSWRAGRSDNHAHWVFQPGAHGGTVTALDEHASDLVEGLPARPLRTVGAVVDMTRPEEEPPPAPSPVEQWRAAASDSYRDRIPMPTDGGRRTPAEPWRPAPPAQRQAEPLADPRPVERRPAEQRPSERPAEQRAPEGPVERPVEQAPAAYRPADPRPAGGGDGVSRGHAEWAPWERGVNRTAVPPLPTPPATGGPARGADVAVPAARTAAANTGAEKPATAAPAEPATTTHAPAPTSATPATSNPPAPASTTAEPVEQATAEAPPSAVEATRAHAEPAPAGPADGAPIDQPSVGRAATDRAETTAPETTAPETAAPAPATPAESTPVESTPADPTPAVETPASVVTEAMEPAPAEPEAAEPAPAAPAATKRTRKGKPVMPSWDEVLLGVRGPR
jgi:Protein of unknown function (DUF3071)